MLIMIWVAALGKNPFSQGPLQETVPIAKKLVAHLQEQVIIVHAILVK